MLLVGVDEAGYGPNLGPLVVGASIWRMPGSRGTDLYQPLRPHVAASLNAPGADAVIADSKIVHSSGKGCRTLEHHLLTVWSAVTRRSLPIDTASFLDEVDTQADRDRRLLPWYEHLPPHIPCDASAQAIDQSSKRLAEALLHANLQCIRLATSSLEPQRFNDAVAKWNSKGTVLSRQSLELVRAVIRGTGEDVYIVCDKHGGRNRYLEVLQDVFDTPWIRVCEESRAISCYAFQQAGRTVEIAFRAKGEQFLPTALASMLAKYQRELSMVALNAYWNQHVIGLRPTAGYPVDAKRFYAEIEPLLSVVGVDRYALWRMR